MSYNLQEGRQKRINLRMTAEVYLREYIQKSKLKSGDLLPPEKELSEKLGISRTAVREALKGLESLGVTAAHQGRGHYVREFNYDAILSSFSYGVKPKLDHFRDVLEIRMYLEPTFLSRDVHLFSKEDIAELREMLHTIEKQTESGYDENELIDLHMSFHHALYRYAKNSLLLDLITMFSQMQHTFTRIHGYHTENRSEFIRLHHEILSALETGHPEIVRSRYVSHFSEPYNWVQRQLHAAENESHHTTGKESMP